MINLTNKSTTLRSATAKTILKVGSQLTIRAIENRSVPKGDVFAMSKAAGLLAVKKTADLFPECHPVPIEFIGIEYRVVGLEVHIEVTVKTIYKTGVELQAMHGASIVALNMFDMLKPIDKNLEIFNLKLIDKKGGESCFQDKFIKDLRAAVIVCSDAIYKEKKEDLTGKIIVEKLKDIDVTILDYVIIPDEKEIIREKAREYQTNGADLIIFTGGTGLTKRDVTPEALRPLLDRTIPGIEETIRRYGQDRMPYAMLSRSLAGTIKNSLVLALPGSKNGARESMDAIFPALLHIFKSLREANAG